MNTLEIRLRQKWAKFCGEDLIISPLLINDSDSKDKNNIDGAINSSSSETVEDGEIIDNYDDEVYDKEEDGGYFSSSNHQHKENSLSNSSVSSFEDTYLEDDLSLNWTTKKREFCKFFREGFCRNASNCTFNHDISTFSNMRQPQLCKFYDQGKCVRKDQCQLLHGEYPCIDNYLGLCNAINCKYSHLPLNDYTQNIVEQDLKARTMLPMPMNYPQRLPIHRPLPPPFFKMPPNSMRPHPYMRPRPSFISSGPWC